MERKIAIFQKKEIRKLIHEDEWWFVVQDVVLALIESRDPKQYIQRMKQRDPELAKGWVQIVHTLPVPTDGGPQPMLCANTEGLFRIIQSIPSPKAEPFKRWLAQAAPGDFVYADPPYAGRHVDYFNSWSDADEAALGELLGSLHCDFLLSTWHSNEFRKNTAIDLVWSRADFHILKREHFYHVGSSEDLRHPMIEALISNFPMVEEVPVVRPIAQSMLFTAESSRTVTQRV